MKIKIGIYGYGNLAKGVEKAVKNCADMELFAIFTRRDPSKVISDFGTKVLPAETVAEYKDSIDVLVNCGGSATDLPKTTPALTEYFNVVDSFDTHANIPEHFAKTDIIAKENKKTAVISCGWDPGIFSLMRLYGEAFLPNSKTYCFWGKGVSQGHSDAIRRIDGVVDARQYTIPVESSMRAVRQGENPELYARDKHIRECFVVCEEGADKSRIEKEIVEMPNYFKEYNTTVHFVTLEELRKNHSGLPHAGNVITIGSTSKKSTHVVEYSLKLDSNPEFTGSVLTSTARACYKLYISGDYGCKTVLDIPPKYFSPADYEEHLAKIL